MGTKDIETAIFFDDDRRYADLLNGYIFDGKQVIMEKQLYSQDTRETGKSQKDSWGVQKRKKIQRFRDGVKRVAFGTSFTIIALEHQDKIHRGMPVRVMVEDALSYDRQMKKLQKKKPGERCFKQKRLYQQSDRHRRFNTSCNHCDLLW